MTVYRIKLFTDKKNHLGDKEYCLENNLMAIGWGFQEERITDVNEYNNKINAENIFDDNKGFKASSKNILNMQKGDLVWTNINGRIYKLGIIDSDCFIVDDDEKCRMGLTRKCIWNNHHIPFDDVPGQVISSFVGGGYVLIKMNNVDNQLEEYCKYLYNPNKYNIPANLNYKKLLHPDDLEDLLGLYLQNTEKYYIIPSTNKTSTKYIEYELRQTNGNRACVQCKTGDAVVDDEIFNEFKKYNKIYICTMKNISYNNKGKNVKTIYTDDLWNWAKLNTNLLPERIKKYVKMCS